MYEYVRVYMQVAVASDDSSQATRSAQPHPCMPRIAPYLAFYEEVVGLCITLHIFNIYAWQ